MAKVDVEGLMSAACTMLSFISAKCSAMCGGVLRAAQVILRHCNLFID